MHFAIIFRTMSSLGDVVRGFLDDQATAHDILGPIGDLERIIRTHFIDQVYITTHADRELVKTLTMKAPRLGVDVSIVPDLFDGIGWNAPVDRVGHFPVLVLHRRHAYALQRLIKRLLDLLGAFIGGLILSPLLLLVAAAIKLESPGPIFYKATRVGRKGRHSTALSFERCTTVPIGKWSRSRTSTNAARRSLRSIVIHASRGSVASCVATASTSYHNSPMYCWER